MFGEALALKCYLALQHYIFLYLLSLHYDLKVPSVCDVGTFIVLSDILLEQTYQRNCYHISKITENCEAQYL